MNWTRTFFPVVLSIYSLIPTYWRMRIAKNFEIDPSLHFSELEFMLQNAKYDHYILLIYHKATIPAQICVIIQKHHGSKWIKRYILIHLSSYVFSSESIAWIYTKSEHKAIISNNSQLKLETNINSIPHLVSIKTFSSMFSFSRINAFNQSEYSYPFPSSTRNQILDLLKSSYKIHQLDGFITKETSLDITHSRASDKYTMCLQKGKGWF